MELKKFKIVGIDYKKGTYEGKNWENWYFHCVVLNPEQQLIAGELTEVIKVSANQIGNFSKGRVVDKTLLGNIFTPYYDRYGTIITCDWIK